MASVKKYSNVYTILEKSRKGELDFSGSGSRFFKTIDSYKRPDLIKPHVHYIDQTGINMSVRQHVMGNENMEKLKTLSLKRGLTTDEKELTEHRSEVYRTFPKGLVNDFYNLFNKPMDQLEFEDRTDENKLRYKFLEKANHPISKIMTEGSNLKSVIFTKHVMEYFVNMLTLLKLQKPDEYEEMMKQASNGGQGKNDDSGDQDGPEGDGQPQSDGGAGKGNTKSSPKSLEQILEDMLKQKANENMLKDVMKKAQDTCQTVNDSMSTEEQEDVWQAITHGDRSALDKVDPQKLARLISELEKVRMSMGRVKDFIKKIMDRSVSYFSAREEIEFDSLFENGAVDQIEDMYMLHPKLRVVMAEDIMVRDIKKMGKINLYIDISGSMSDSCGVRSEDGSRITKLDFAKSFAFKMKELNMVNEVYEFNTQVRRRGTKVADILGMHCSGGTSINAVVDHIKKAGENSLIITDAEDYCSIYSEKAFFIGVEGADFTRFHSLDQYQEQLCVFDGKGLYKVDLQGNTVK